MNIEIWSVGKENEPFINDGLKYYFTKTKPYANVELVIIKPPKKLATTDIEKTKGIEEELILKKILVKEVRLTNYIHPKKRLK